MATHTLQKMAEGGIYDQLGGGFCRYSTDPYWRIPHFEKMLYDNAPLLRLYADAWLATRNPLFERVVEETARMGNARDAAARRRNRIRSHRKRAITPRWMPIPKTRKANSMFGIAMRWRGFCARKNMPSSLLTTDFRMTRTSRASIGISKSRSRLPTLRTCGRRQSGGSATEARIGAEKSS